MNSRIYRLLSAVILFTLLSLSTASPAYAYDGRGGDKVIVKAGEVVNDDLYIGANEFVLDGTVNGDTVAFGQMVTINGTIKGDLITAAQTVVVNGTVGGNIRMAGSVLFVGEKASVGGDIVAAGYSLELRKGSTVKRDLVVASGQTLLAANIGRNVQAYTGALEIDGNVGGNVKASVGEASQNRSGPPPSMFMPRSSVTMPIVKPGLSLDPSAKIGGNLEYTQNNDLLIPAGVVAGKVTRVVQPEQKNATPVEKTVGQKVGDWALRAGRSMVTLILVGLLLLWLFPFFTSSVSNVLQNKPWPSLGWGVVAYAGFFFALLLLVFVTILGAVAFGLLTLGGLSASIVVLGLLALFGLIVGFVLATAFVAKVAFGMALGKWILKRANPSLAEHKYWPMVIGVVITVAVIALLTFPLIPGFFGGLLNFGIVLAGLGALWLVARESLQKKPVPVSV